MHVTRARFAVGRSSAQLYTNLLVGFKWNQTTTTWIAKLLFFQSLLLLSGVFWGKVDEKKLQLYRDFSRCSGIQVLLPEDLMAEGLLVVFRECAGQAAIFVA